MPSVMIVDDAEAMRGFLAAIVHDELHFGPIISVKNGAQALATLHNDGPVDLMLIDINMPEMDGISLVKEIRKRSGWNEIKIIMVTTETQMDSVDSAFALGVDSYIMKPFSPASVKDQIEALY